MQVPAPAQGVDMTKFEEMSSYVNDASRNAVCGEMASIIGVKDSDTKDKLAFETIEIALSKAEKSGLIAVKCRISANFVNFGIWVKIFESVTMIGSFIFQKKTPTF